MPAPFKSGKWRKCFYFDDEGEPRVQRNGTVGCSRGHSCVFAHPRDVEWASASPSRPPPGFYDANLKEPHRIRTRPPSSPPPRDRRPTDSGYSSTSKRDRDSADIPDMRHRREPSAHGRAAERSPARSVASAEAHEAPLRSRLAPNNDPHSSSNGFERTTRDLPAPVAQKRPTPPDTRPTPMHPPHSLPAKPSSNGHLPQSIDPSRLQPAKELTFEEKRAAWVDRIRLMSEAVVTRSELLRLQKEVQTYQRLKQSRRFVEIPEENRAQMDAQLATALQHCEDKKQALGAIVTQLTGTDVWPVEQLGQRVLDGNPTETKASIAELRANVQQIFDALRTAAPAAVNARVSDVVDRQLSPHIGPPAKRRRLSPSLDQSSSTLSFGNQGQSGLNGLDDVLDMLRKFEGRLSDLENDMIQHDNDLLEEVEERIQFKLGGFHSDHSLPTASSSQPGGQLLTAPVDEKAVLDVSQSGELGRFKQEVDVMGDQVGELAQEVADLILQMRTRDGDNARLRQENEQLMQEVEALKRQQQQNQDAIDESKQEIRALSAAVMAHLSHSADPPLVPPVPEMETIVAAVEPLVLRSVREDIKPLLGDMHTSVGKMLQEQHSQAYATVLSKISTTTKTVEVISDWMERIRRGEHVEHSAASLHDGNVQTNP